MMPGNPVSTMISRLSTLGEIYGTTELVEYYKKQFALEGTLWDQFLAYLIELSKGNLGVSFTSYPTPVSVLIMHSLPYSLGLMLPSMLISWTLGTIMGGTVGWKGKKLKMGAPLSFISIIFANIPYFMLALIFVFLFCYTFPIFPSGGAYSPTIIPSFTLNFIQDLIFHAIGPIICITLSQLAMWFLHMRALVVDIKDDDFIMYGEARGLGEKRMLASYAIRNCLLPQVTELSMMLGWVFGGSLLTEIVFRYPGMGMLLFSAVVNLDYPVIMGVTLLTIIAVNVALVILDLLLLPLLDPRVREE